MAGAKRHLHRLAILVGDRARLIRRDRKRRLRPVEQGCRRVAAGRDEGGCRVQQSRPVLWRHPPRPRLPLAFVLFLQPRGLSLESAPQPHVSHSARGERCEDDDEADDQQSSAAHDPLRWWSHVGHPYSLEPWPVRSASRSTAGRCGRLASRACSASAAASAGVNPASRAAIATACATSDARRSGAPDAIETRRPDTTSTPIRTMSASTAASRYVGENQIRSSRLRSGRTRGIAAPSTRLRTSPCGSSHSASSNNRSTRPSLPRITSYPALHATVRAPRGSGLRR